MIPTYQPPKVQPQSPTVQQQGAVLQQKAWQPTGSIRLLVLFQGMLRGVWMVSAIVASLTVLYFVVKMSWAFVRYLNAVQPW